MADLFWLGSVTGVFLATFGLIGLVMWLRARGDSWTD